MDAARDHVLFHSSEAFRHVLRRRLSNLVDFLSFPFDSIRFGFRFLSFPLDDGKGHPGRGGTDVVHNGLGWDGNGDGDGKEDSHPVQGRTSMERENKQALTRAREMRKEQCQLAHARVKEERCPEQFHGFIQTMVGWWSDDEDRNHPWEEEEKNVVKQGQEEPYALAGRDVHTTNTNEDETPHTTLK